MRVHVMWEGMSQHLSRRIILLIRLKIVFLHFVHLPRSKLSRGFIPRIDSFGVVGLVRGR